MAMTYIGIFIISEQFLDIRLFFMAQNVNQKSLPPLNMTLIVKEHVYNSQSRPESCL